MTQEGRRRDVDHQGTLDLEHLAADPVPAVRGPGDDLGRLTPLVGVLLGIVVLGERPAWHHLVGAVLVVAGIAIGQGRLRLARQ